VIANEYGGLIPLELFTYASYPHDLEGCMEYNVNNSLLAGHGFWGDLSLMTEKQRAFVGRQVRQSKRILPYLSETEPIITGKVGDSPEIYSIINGGKGAGQIISFSENPADYSFEQKLNTSELLAVLNNPYDAREGLLQMDLIHEKKESTSAIFVLPNKGSGISIVSSTSAITDAHSDGEQLSFQVDRAGTQIIKWPSVLDEPNVIVGESVDFRIESLQDGHLLTITSMEDQKSSIRIETMK